MPAVKKENILKNISGMGAEIDLFLACDATYFFTQ